jgi:hypothetical protein
MIELLTIAIGVAGVVLTMKPDWLTNHIAHAIERWFRW